MMGAIEFEDEVALIAQAMGLAQKGFDFVVDSMLCEMNCCRSIKPGRRLHRKLPVLIWSGL